SSRARVARLVGLVVRCDALHLVLVDPAAGQEVASPEIRDDVCQRALDARLEMRIGRLLRLTDSPFTVSVEPARRDELGAIDVLVVLEQGPRGSLDHPEQLTVEGE